MSCPGELPQSIGCRNDREIRVPQSAAQLLEYAKQFERRLADAKVTPPTETFQWYPYDTISSIALLAPLLEDNFAAFQAGLEGKMLDIGCGDGDLSFLFASLGCQIAAIDLPDCNFNWMTGVRALRTRLDLPIDIREMNVDSQFQLDGGPYGLALLLGILYHLKNPFHVLETLARNARYCLLSTRVAEKTMAGTAIRDEPVAYLLDHREANDDPTNFWVFSQQGLLRLAKRTGWRVLGWRCAGCTSGSNPASASADERMFLFLRSQLCSAPARIKLLTGWTEPLAQKWAWTEKKFSIEVTMEELRRPPSFLLGFVVPESVASVSPVTVHCAVNGHPAGTEVFQGSGDKLFEKPLPAEVDNKQPMLFEFSVEHSFDPRPDPRDLGIVMPFTGAIHGTDSPILFWLN
ncbi:MAG: methyltransferase domain-containing protein [Bryobacteraceae bacterium]